MDVKQRRFDMKKRLSLVVSLSVLVAVFAGGTVCWAAYQAWQGGLHVSYRPQQFHSREELLQAKAAAMAGGYDPYNLKDMEFYYTSTYPEAWCELNHFAALGSQTMVTLYNLRGSERTFGYDFTLQAGRDPDQRSTAEALLAYIIEDRNCKPWIVEGVYYYDVNNSSLDEGLPDFRNFYWIHDGYFFEMYLSTELLERIEQNDPEAFQGRIFEVVKIYL